MRTFCLADLITPLLRLTIPAAVLCILSACNDPDYIHDRNAVLDFSMDTVHFDTIFTARASSVQQLKIYNPYHQPILIHSIQLAGGEDSFFQLNINGTNATYSGEISLPPKDSLYVFIAANIDPLGSDNPLIIKDSILFEVNGNLQDVKIIAYGQDVNLIRGGMIESETWNSAKPYLILETLAVDTGETLMIEKGSRLYFHKNAGLTVYGSLQVNGTKEEPVCFLNDRPEEFYDILPGQWGSIILDGVSTNNWIRHAIIRNAVTGIQVGRPSDETGTVLELSNSMIRNVSFAGIYAFGADITCYNTIVADCAGPALALLKGGNYRFYHCTISNRGVVGIARTTPSLILSNFAGLEASGSPFESVAGDLRTAVFHNCIVTGNAFTEVEFRDNGENDFLYYFNHCLLKLPESQDGLDDPDYFSYILLNEDPGFVNDSDRYKPNLRPDTLSVMLNAGDERIVATFSFLENDLDGNLRNQDEAPDLGAYEFIIE